MHLLTVNYALCSAPLWNEGLHVAKVNKKVNKMLTSK